MNVWLKRTAWIGGLIGLIFAIIIGPKLGSRVVNVIRYRWMVEKNPYQLTVNQTTYLERTYSNTAREVLYRNIPRSLVPELEPVLQEFMPLLRPISNLNLTKVFPRGGIDLKLQTQANSSNLTKKDFRTLGFYETVRSYQDPYTNKYTRKHLKKYANFKMPRRSRGVFGPDKKWMLVSGRLTHQSLVENDVPWYWWPFTWFDSSYKIPIHKRFYQQFHVKVTGLFYYPPGGYAEWHTNRYDIVGWRFYYIRTSEPNRSWFRYKHARNETIHLAPDGKEHYNMFYLERKEDELVWHSVYSDTDRWSIGFNVPSTFAHLILARLNNDTHFPLPSENS